MPETEHPVHYRPAKSQDAVALWEIYMPFVRDTAYTFETEVFSVAEMRRRIEQDPIGHPWVVAEQGGVVVGYAYGSPHRVRAAYHTTREVSVYLANAAKGKNIAARLYESLFPILRENGFTNVLAGITIPNPASVRFHEKMGFVKCAEYHRIGFKFNAWHDVAWYERWIGEEE